MKKLLGLILITFAFSSISWGVNETLPDQEIFDGLGTAEQRAYTKGFNDALKYLGNLSRDEQVKLIGNGVTRDGYGEEFEDMDDIMDPVLRYVEDWGDRCDDKRYCNQSNDILQEL